MKLRVLVELVLGRAGRAAGTARGISATGFELMVAPSRENPGRYAIGSVREIDRRAVLEVLRAFGLAGTPALVPLRSLLERGGRDDGIRTAGPRPRIRLVRLTPPQASSVFAEIRSRDPGVRKLYAHLEAKGLAPIREEARGSVMRAYAADGAARGEGIVVELPHRRADGTKASFHVSVRDWMAGETRPGEVRAEYEIRDGEQVETYEIKDGRLVEELRVREKGRRPWSV